MRVRKVYITKDADLSHAVLVKGNRVRIHFTGSNPSPKRCGTLITEDTALQEAIEADCCFGVLFDLQSETELPDKGKKATVSQPQTVSTAVGSTAESDEENKSNTTTTAASTEEADEELEMATNFNKAREYLRTKHNIQMSQMANTQAVLTVATELGVVFPNWKPAIV